MSYQKGIRDAKRKKKQKKFSVVSDRYQAKKQNKQTKTLKHGNELLLELKRILEKVTTWKEGLQQ